jgi:hypothetical protein
MRTRSSALAGGLAAIVAVFILALLCIREASAGVENLVANVTTDQFDRCNNEKPP